MPDHNEQIDTYLQSNLDEYISEAIRLCAQPSVSAKREGLEECAQLVAEILEAHGVTTQLLPTPGAPVVVGRAEGLSPRTLLLYNHYDVQPAEPLDLWDSPPFEPQVRDGKLFARGSADDKGEIIARLAALDAVRSANGGQLPCTILWVIEGQEEIGSPHIANFVKEHIDLLKCDGSIWEGGGVSPDERPTNVLGYRGILSVQLEAETMSRDAHSGLAHILPSAAWRLVRALATLTDENDKVTIAGFYDNALPPTQIDLDLISRMPDQEDNVRANYGVREFVRGATGDVYKRAEFEPTCNIQGMITGWTGEGVKTVIPARSLARIDFRLVPGQDPDDIYEKLCAHLVSKGFDDIKVTRLGAMWPAKSPGDDPLALLTNTTTEEVYGVPPIVAPLSGGSSPVYAFAVPLGIPVVNAGIGYEHSRAHAPNENFRLTDFLLGMRHIARIIEGFAGISHDC